MSGYICHKSMSIINCAILMPM
uniref:Uncharacterized protein n=1 Tax=Arundo donax TaxID=35708 RepID=A0A0A9H546_ARUDO